MPIDKILSSARERVNAENRGDTWLCCGAYGRNGNSSDAWGRPVRREIRNVLVVGVDLVGLALSARRAGYRVYAADYFGDLDLGRACEECLSIVQQRAGESAGRIESKFQPDAFLEMAESLSERAGMDAVLLSSGLDDHFDVLRELNELVGILGNPPETIRKVRGRDTFFEGLRRLGIQHPHTTVANSLDEARSSAKDAGFPVVLKPLEGFAGSAVRRAENQRQLEKAFHEVKTLSEGGVLIQEHIGGTHASISFMASPAGVRVLSLNEQLLGLPEVHQREPFGYCGNVVPLQAAEATERECRRIAEEIGRHFGLMGSNGVDVVISESGVPFVIEVNPRFQGTLECVERALGLNLVRTHIDACIRGCLPPRPAVPTEFFTRLILYAPGRVAAPDLTAFEEVRDIPLPGAIIEGGEPLCSIITEGKRRCASLGRAREKADSIYNMLSQ